MILRSLLQLNECTNECTFVFITRRLTGPRRAIDTHRIIRQDPYHWVIIVAILAVIAAVLIQQTENIFLVPHIMGNALELHPVVIIIGILALSSRMGLIGAVFAAPMIALFKEILYFIICKIKRQDPYPDLFEKIEKTE